MRDKLQQSWDEVYQSGYNKGYIEALKKVQKISNEVFKKLKEITNGFSKKKE